MMTRFLKGKWFMRMLGLWVLLVLFPAAFFALVSPNDILAVEGRLYYPYDWRVWIDTPYIDSSRLWLMWFVKYTSLKGIIDFPLTGLFFIQLLARYLVLG